MGLPFRLPRPYIRLLRRIIGVAILAALFIIHIRVLMKYNEYIQLKQIRDKVLKTSSSNYDDWSQKEIEDAISVLNNRIIRIGNHGRNYSSFDPDIGYVDREIRTIPKTNPSAPPNTTSAAYSSTKQTAISIFESELQTGWSSRRRGKVKPTSTGGAEVVNIDKCPGAIHRQGNNSHTWQKIDNRTFLFSAFLEYRQRQAAVRIVGIMEWRNPPKWCHLFYNRQRQPQRLHVQAKVIPEFHGKPYAASEFICHLSSRLQRPCGVTLTHAENSTITGFIPITSVRSTRHPSTNFTACIPPLFNFTDVHLLVENIEMKIQFGAQFFIVYVESVDINVWRYLEHYRAVGLVRIVTWKLPIELDVHYHGQLAALTDCMLNSMYTSRYVVFSDVDEVIVPANASDWMQMIQDIGAAESNLAVYLFRNTFVPLICDPQDPPDDSDLERSVKTCKIKSLQHRVRSDPPHRPMHYSKCIVDPKGVETVGIHGMHALRARYWSTVVLPPYGMLWHYRQKVTCHLFRTVADDRLLEFAKPLAFRICGIHEAMNSTRKEGLT